MTICHKNTIFEHNLSLEKPWAICWGRFFRSGMTIDQRHLIDFLFWDKPKVMMVCPNKETFFENAFSSFSSNLNAKHDDPKKCWNWKSFRLNAMQARKCLSIANYSQFSLTLNKKATSHWVSFHLSTSYVYKNEVKWQKSDVWNMFTQTYRIHKNATS